MLSTAKRIVIKIGSSLIIGEGNSARLDWLKSLAEDIYKLKSQGKEIIIVSSGAVALGRKHLGYENKILTLEEKQASAACGQITLVSHWADILKTTTDGLKPAQLLLTADDINNKTRAENASNTLEALLKNSRIVPVINENDTVATEELRVGDNDSLAAYVAKMAGADLLILFSDIKGLYNKNPRTTPDAILQQEIPEITPEIEAMAGGAGSAVGTGGMITKIAAAKIATSAGCNMIIALGTENHPLNALLNGGEFSTFFAKK
jgi:glutamate 5-kinase